MKYQKRHFILIGLVTTLTACSDFSDYNTTPELSVEGGELTLLQNMEKDSRLSDFVDIIKKAGYDQELNQTKLYTVWAPINGTYDAQTLMQQGPTTLLEQFVKTHVTNFSHILKTGQSETVRALNGKLYPFSELQYGEQTVDQLNRAASNGVFHTINGYQSFRPNLYEYITASDRLSKVRSYVLSYETTVLDKNNSTLGPIINGKQTYSDSVMITNNALFNRIGANMNVEDSTYTALLPTDKAWDDAFNLIRPYYNYPDQLKATNVSGNTDVVDTQNIDAVQLGDSLTRITLFHHLFFNNNDYWNRWVTGRDDAQTTDTLMATTRTRYVNGPELLSFVNEKEPVSNGLVLITDTLAYHTTLWAPIITMPGISISRPRISNATVETWQDSAIDYFDEETGYVSSYLYVKYFGARSVAGAYFYLGTDRSPVMATTYDITAVIVPAGYKGDEESNALPNKLTAEINYLNADGQLVTETLTTNVQNDPTRPDWIHLGTVTFPYAYRSGFAPYLHIYNNLTAREFSSYDRSLRIAAIIMTPKPQSEL